MSDGQTFQRNVRVVQCEVRPVGIRVSLPVDRALDTMVDEANRAGANTTRAELLGALVAGRHQTAEQLVRLLSSYRKLDVGTLLKLPADRDSIVLSKKTKGRPRATDTMANRWHDQEGK